MRLLPLLLAGMFVAAFGVWLLGPEPETVDRAEDAMWIIGTVTFFLWMWGVIGEDDE
jgi:hypothetical protein